jgi:hypothetical protein
LFLLSVNSALTATSQPTVADDFLVLPVPSFPPPDVFLGEVNRCVLADVALTAAGADVEQLSVLTFQSAVMRHVELLFVARNFVE